MKMFCNFSKAYEFWVQLTQVKAMIRFKKIARRSRMLSRDQKRTFLPLGRMNTM
jgi:hypothetical protein